MPILCLLLADMKISLFHCNCSDSWKGATFKVKLLFGYWMTCICSSALTGMSLGWVCVCVYVHARMRAHMHVCMCTHACTHTHIADSYLGDITGHPDINQWQLYGIADVHCVGGNALMEGLDQMPQDKLQMSLATRKIQMMVVLTPGKTGHWKTPKYKNLFLPALLYL